VITRVGMDRSGEEKKNPFPHYNTGQNHNTKTANKFLKNVIKFEYLGATLWNENHIRDEVKIRLQVHSGTLTAIRFRIAYLLSYLDVTTK